MCAGWAAGRGVERASAGAAWPWGALDGRRAHCPKCPLHLRGATAEGAPLLGGCEARGVMVRAAVRPRETPHPVLCWAGAHRGKAPTEAG